VSACAALRGLSDQFTLSLLFGRWQQRARHSAPRRAARTAHLRRALARAGHSSARCAFAHWQLQVGG
jgi:hypothetical protein